MAVVEVLQGAHVPAVQTVDLGALRGVKQWADGWNEKRRDGMAASTNDTVFARSLPFLALLPSAPALLSRQPALLPPSRRSDER